MALVAHATRTAHILVVDDDPNILTAAESLLGALGNRVTTARTRREAMTQLDAGAYDVLMTDLTMPDCSGWDLARYSKMRAPAKPVIMMTGWGLALDAKEMRTGVVNGVLTKPFSADEVQRTLGQLW